MRFLLIKLKSRLLGVPFGEITGLPLYCIFVLCLLFSCFRIFLFGRIRVYTVKIKKGGDILIGGKNIRA
jgi:hypothetical protein